MKSKKMMDACTEMTVLDKKVEEGCRRSMRSPAAVGSHSDLQDPRIAELYVTACASGEAQHVEKRQRTRRETRLDLLKYKRIFASDSRSRRIGQQSRDCPGRLFTPRQLVSIATRTRHPFYGDCSCFDVACAAADGVAEHFNGNGLLRLMGFMQLCCAALQTGAGALPSYTIWGDVFMTDFSLWTKDPFYIDYYKVHTKRMHRDAEAMLPRFGGLMEKQFMERDFVPDGHAFIANALVEQSVKGFPPQAVVIWFMTNCDTLLDSQTYDNIITSWEFAQKLVAFAVRHAMMSIEPRKGHGGNSHADDFVALFTRHVGEHLHLKLLD